METIEKSVELAIERIQNKSEPEDLRRTLLMFYQERTVEILEHLEEQGVGKVINYDNIKVGGTSNDDN